MPLFSRKAFTLIELIIVVIIIGIVSAIAAPIMSGVAEKARQVEAISMLGSIRTAERMYYVEYGQYSADVSDFSDPGNPLGAYIRSGDLNGTYYSGSCYSFSKLSDSHYQISCDSSHSTNPPSPKAGEVNGNAVIIVMDENGTVTGNK